MDDEIVQCGDCGNWLPICRCKGRCQVCLEWKDRCVCKGKPRPGASPGAKKAEWLCFECEEPLDYCQCGTNPYENLLKAALHIKDPRQRKKALKAIVALIAKKQGRKVGQGDPIDYGAPAKPPSRRQPKTQGFPRAGRTKP